MEEVSCSDQFSEGQLLGLELAIRFEQSYCEYQIGVTLGNDAKLAAACSQSTIRTASLPLPDI